MQIGFDSSRTAETKTGLGSYACSLLTALAAIDGDNRYVLHPFTWHCFPEHFERAFRPRRRNFQNARRWTPRRWIERWWRDGTRDHDWLIGGPHDVFFSPFHAVPPRQMGKLVCVFHDVAFLAHPEFATEENRRFCEEQLGLAVHRADLLLTVSEFSRQELLRWTGLPQDKVRAVLLAADPMFRPIADVAVPTRLAAAIGASPFFLFVGSQEPRKNLLTLVHAYASLVVAGTAPGKLVIAGGSGWKNSDVFAAIAQLGLTERVVFTGFVTDDELVALYNRALAFVYPTIYEGFGLPVIEAMACGCPVITTRVASIPEVGGEAVIYVDEPKDVAGLAAAMQRLAGDTDARAQLRTRGLSRAATFTWEKTARATLQAFEEVVRDRTYDRREVVMGSDERGLDRGFHGLEQGDGGPFRWARMNATVWLSPRAGRSLQVTLGTPIVSGQTLVVRVRGKVIGGPLELRQGWQTLTIPGALPDSDRDVPIELVTNRGLDAAHKGHDPRELAIMVRRVSLN